jgi:hypothetical protein
MSRNHAARAEISMSEAKERAAQLRTEILAALATGHAYTTTELEPLCPSALDLAQIANQVGNLRKSGDIVPSVLRVPPTGRPQATYRLAAASTLSVPDITPEDTPEPLDATQTARLAEVIESTLTDAWLHATDPADLCPPFEGPVVGFSDRRYRDAITQAILAAPDPAPRILEAPMYIGTLSAMIERLESRRPVMPNIDLVARLADLRDLLEELA